MRGAPRAADRPLYRIGRAPNPWAWPDWLRASHDRTFGNRFDDPLGDYRVLYAGSTRLGAFVEVLARFRPDPHVAAELAKISGDGKGALPPGHLDAGWLAVRRIGSANVAGRFAEIGHSESLAELERALAARLAHHGIASLDAAAIRLSVPRRLTQEISRYVYELDRRARPARVRRHQPTSRSSATSSGTGRSSSRSAGARRRSS